MKSILVILGFILGWMPGMGQPIFKTVVPQKPLVVDESFQVQYIITDENKLNNFTAPEFRNFRKVSGPHIYVGTLGAKDDAQQVQNTVYTLMPLYPGRFLIPGATVIINNKTYRSNDELVQVITKEEAIMRSRKEMEPIVSEYFLRPGEDPYEKIRNNLFVKVIVDKNKCFVGQPVVATFKLYSRLESKSDIVKNPGFYGFTVYDMVNLEDRQGGSEVVNGKTFDVHTIRKVQLYPLRGGNYSVDPMEIKNTVEFSRSIVNKKTEQEIAEGVLKNNAPIPNDGSELYETTLSTKPVAIKVREAPIKNKPDSFNGATGHFSINARIIKNQLARNEQGSLELTIAGQGNFTQLVAPAIEWPAGIEGFEPAIADKLDRHSVPLLGKRIFHYSFVSAKQGEYIIPSVQFVYLNPDSGGYRTISTPDLKVSVSANEKPIESGSFETIVGQKNRRGIFWLAAGGFFLIAIVVAFLFMRRGSGKPVPTPVYEKSIPASVTIRDQLSPVYLLSGSEDHVFYAALRNAIWQFFSIQFNWTGSQLTKHRLTGNLRELNIEADLVHKLHEILDQCEAGMFTNANLPANKAGMVHETELILTKVSEKLF